MRLIVAGSTSSRILTQARGKHFQQGSTFHWASVKQLLNGTGEEENRFLFPVITLSRTWNIRLNQEALSFP